jgi:DNA-binding GntR family transcriptional regulator
MKKARTRLPKLTPVDEESVHEKVYNELRHALMRGRFVPGAPITLRALAGALGTSATPIRTALRQLVAEQALVSRPNRSVTVPLVTAERFNEIRGIRVALESMLTEEAAKKISPSDLRRLEKLNEEMTAAVAAGDTRRYLARNQEFHFTIYRAAQLPITFRLVESLWLQIGPLLNFLLTSDNKRPNRYFDRVDRQFEKYHRAAVEALQRGDGAAARQSIADDINVAADYLLSNAELVAATQQLPGQQGDFHSGRRDGRVS